MDIYRDINTKWTILNKNMYLKSPNHSHDGRVIIFRELKCENYAGISINELSLKSNLVFCDTLISIFSKN